MKRVLLASASVIACMLAIGIVGSATGFFPGARLSREYRATYYTDIQAECLGKGGKFIEELKPGAKYWLCIEGEVLSSGARFNEDRKAQ